MQTWLVPGFTQTADSWDAVVDALRGRHIDRIHALEIPDCTSFTETADALATTSRRGIWCGYSMGGRLALCIALRHPDLVRRLVLVSATPGIASEVDRAARRTADNALAESALADGSTAFLTRWMAQPMFAEVPADAPGIQQRQSFTPTRIAHDLRVLGTGSMPNLWDRLHELRMPVTIVTGERDDKFTDIGHRMQERISNSSVRTIDCGHAIPLEQGLALAQILHEIHSAAAKNNEETS